MFDELLSPTIFGGTVYKTKWDITGLSTHTLVDQSEMKAGRALNSNEEWEFINCQIGVFNGHENPGKVFNFNRVFSSLNK